MNCMTGAARSNEMHEFEGAIRSQILSGHPRFEVVPESTIEITSTSARQQQQPAGAVNIGRVLCDDFLIPALAANSWKSFADFWVEHALSFQKLFGMYVRHLRESNLPPRPKSALWKLAYDLNGEASETALRSAAVDLAFSRRLLQRFAGQDFTSEDAVLAPRYNMALALHLGAVNSLTFANDTRRPLTDEQRDFIPHFVRATSNIACNVALDGAAHHAASTEFELTCLSDGWEKPCEAMFRYVAERAPQRVLDYVRDQSLSAGLRTRAVNAISSVADQTLAETLLIQSLQSESPVVVREAAIHGLAHRALGDRALACLRKVASEPTEHAVLRETAEEALAPA